MYPKIQLFKTEYFDAVQGLDVTINILKQYITITKPRICLVHCARLRHCTVVSSLRVFQQGISNKVFQTGYFDKVFQQGISTRYFEQGISQGFHHQALF